MKVKSLISGILLVALFFVSCRKAAIVGNDNCIDRIQKVSESLNTYVQNPSVDNCKAYVDALRKYVNAGACFGNIYFEEYKKELNELEEDECN